MTQSRKDMLMILGKSDLWAIQENRFFEKNLEPDVMADLAKVDMMTIDDAQNQGLVFFRQLWNGNCPC